MKLSCRQLKFAHVDSSVGLVVSEPRVVGRRYCQVSSTAHRRLWSRMLQSQCISSKGMVRWATTPFCNNERRKRWMVDRKLPVRVRWILFDYEWFNGGGTILCAKEKPATRIPAVWYLLYRVLWVYEWGNENRSAFQSYGKHNAWVLQIRYHFNVSKP
jgi:hypothetical protein